MTFTQKAFYSILLVAAIAALVAGSLVSRHNALGATVQVPGIAIHTISQPKETQDFYNFFTATTTSATSTTGASLGDGNGYMRISGATDVIFYFSRGDTKGTGNSGSSQFRVQVTPDGVNWFDYLELGQVNQSGTADVFFTRTGTTTISAATSTQIWAMEDISFYGVRCIVVRTTDGESTCKATATF